ncbi:hypothetical protein M8C21_019105 [Ambrosia artemisiifolia]|uniref:Uncharacterized protein n=1 Tax=Ambrosia artemisiifolia TaxID=4212 RepID=A0AAD5CVD4_AMBAR|nr:hypothetical protein M8C21_019105 [Ambrosia artemisiifolia]
MEKNTVSKERIHCNIRRRLKMRSPEIF